MKGYSDYIVFVLGCDSSRVSNLIREKLKENSDLYETWVHCRYIASRFQEYDKTMINVSQIESFYKFLEDYEDQIVSYLNNEISGIVLRGE